MDNHSLRSQKDEGHRGHAATNQRHGKKTWYHAIRRASPRERHQDPPKGRRCQRNGQEMSCLLTPPRHDYCCNRFPLGSGSYLRL